MTVEISTGSIAGIRWLGLRGERSAAFRALGETTRADVRATLDATVAGERLAGRLRSTRDRAAIDALIATTRRRHPVQVAEVEALAAGAGVDPELALAANLRGDLGSDGSGCSDLGWRRARSYLAHNEDGHPATRLTILTLSVDGDPTVAVEWYPGFSPSNSFVVTAHGLAWGIDHLTVDRPAPGVPGRHFVARTMQHCATLDDVVAYLSANPSAGGFAYNLTELATGRVATVEVAAGRTAVVHADPDARPLLAHTNHVRVLAAEGTTAAAKSLDRAAVLDALAPPADEPDVAWFLDLLAGACLPDGVCQPRGSRGMTLCTAVVDVAAEQVTFQPADGTPETIGYEALLAGPALPSITLT